MAKTDKRVAQNYRIKPLTIATPFYKDESITSWLVRAALNQGCDPQTLAYYFWPSRRVWTCDVDKGFKHIDPHIHADMAVLARTVIDDFDDQNLMSLSQPLSDHISSRTPVPWTQPLSKRNRYSRIGYPYCPDCMKDGKSAYLKLQWRFTWSVCCTQHKKLLQTECPHCDHPYQPQLINAEQRFINHCHFCRSKLGKAGHNSIPTAENYQFQLKIDKVFHDKQGTVLGETVSMNDWFDYLIFLINIVRIALRNPNYMFAKLLLDFGIDVSSLSLPKTALRFDYLPIEERALLLRYAFYLFEITCEDWLRGCKELDVTQNSFQWSRHTVIPQAFHQVYNQLPKTPTRKYLAQSEEVQPASPEAVTASWNRLKRKITMLKYYDNHLKKD